MNCLNQICSYIISELPKSKIVNDYSISPSSLGVFINGPSTTGDGATVGVSMNDPSTAGDGALIGRASGVGGTGLLEFENGVFVNDGGGVNDNRAQFN